MEISASNIKSVIDPVCRMKLDPDQTKASMHYKGQAYFFCSLACQALFMRNPAKYLKPRNFVERFLDRLVRSNEREYGSGGPCCH
jgi:YHS domain-containing protein